MRRNRTRMLTLRYDIYFSFHSSSISISIFIFYFYFYFYYINKLAHDDDHCVPGILRTNHLIWNTTLTWRHHKLKLAISHTIEYSRRIGHATTYCLPNLGGRYASPFIDFHFKTACQRERYSLRALTAPWCTAIDFMSHFGRLASAACTYHRPTPPGFSADLFFWSC